MDHSGWSYDSLECLLYLVNHQNSQFTFLKKIGLILANMASCYFKTGFKPN